MSRNEKLILRFGLGIPAIFFVVFLTYWFGIRDTWETDNFSQIADRCKAAQRAISLSPDEEAARACEEVFRFIAERQIKSDYLVERVDAVREAYDPVKARLEQARREREAHELAERQGREARERGARRAQASTDRSLFYNPARDPPYLANEISGHRTRSGAIAALASQFDQSMSWVERNMGSSNSLDQIHANLVRAMLTDAGVQ